MLFSVARDLFKMLIVVVQFLELQELGYNCFAWAYYEILYFLQVHLKHCVFLLLILYFLQVHLKHCVFLLLILYFLQVHLKH